MKSIHQFSIFALLLLISVMLTGCGSGSGGASAAATPSDFSGTWSGNTNGIVLVYTITQTGSSLTMTRTTPPTSGVTYTGVITGNSAAVTISFNNVPQATATLNLSNSTTMTETVNTCTATTGFICPALGSVFQLTKSTSASSSSFPLLDPLTALYHNGWSKSFNVTGDCTGAGTVTNASAVPDTTTMTADTTAFSSTQRTTYSGTPCSAVTTAGLTTTYYNSAYIPLGSSSLGYGIGSSGIYYGEYTVKPIIPKSVQVGNTGTIGTETLWASSSKGSSIGTMDVSYAVTAFTDTTAIVTITSTMSNTTPTVIQTEKDQWLVTSTGTLTPVSKAIIEASTPAINLIWTYQ